MPIDHKKIQQQIEQAYKRKPIVDHTPDIHVDRFHDHSFQREETPQERERRERQWKAFNHGYQPPEEDLE